MYFYLSKCVLGERCEENKDTYASFIKIPYKTIAENKSFEFKVNLADLYWKDAKIYPAHVKNIKNFKTIPSENIYFYAQIKALEGYKMKNHGPRYNKAGKLTRVLVRKTPIYKIVSSNVIGVSFT
jgi:hypothetical protein